VPTKPSSSKERERWIRLARLAPRRAAQRERMVERQIRARGVRDPAVLRAVGQVPRELFVPDSLADLAYEDTALPIEAGQTISQPYVLALMVEALELEGGERVLEVGTGSGYGAAVLSHLAAQVYTIEQHAELAERAQQRLVALDCANVHVIHGDGSRGWAERAPYEAIVVTATAPGVPRELRAQLLVGGRLVIPVGPRDGARILLRIRRSGPGAYPEEALTDVHFVPLAESRPRSSRDQSSPR
jgi:protein-L-isoaspartate(D-aspartate) O-methyltransferase